jgi:hypothetical protein
MIAISAKHVSRDSKSPDLYTLALPDVLSYLIHALSSTTYVEPGLNASNNVSYPPLFKELKTIM